MESVARVPISVTILTKNEEALIERCIRSVAWSDEILVLDSFSTDRTCEIARNAGAVVHKQEWLGWVPQHRRAIELARNDWILVLDADEIVTRKMAAAIKKVMASQPRPEDGYSMDRRDELFGRVLPNMRRNKMRRTFVRLFNRTRSHYDPTMIVHERVVSPGNVILLSGVLLHWRNVGFIEQQHKSADYAVIEANALEDRGVRPSVFRMFVRPFLRFGWCFIVRRSFRVGTTGLIYALLAAQSEFLRNVVLWEKQNAKRTIDPPDSLL